MHNWIAMNVKWARGPTYIFIMKYLIDVVVRWFTIYYNFIFLFWCHFIKMIHNNTVIWADKYRPLCLFIFSIFLVATNIPLPNVLTEYWIVCYAMHLIPLYIMFLLILIDGCTPHNIVCLCKVRDSWTYFLFSIDCLLRQERLFTDILLRCDI